MFDEDLAKQRDEMGGNFGDARAWLVLADSAEPPGQVRHRRHCAQPGLETYPDDADLWVALGNALVGHSNGLLTPASQFAYQKAATLAPDHPGTAVLPGAGAGDIGQVAAGTDHLGGTAGAVAARGRMARRPDHTTRAGRCR